MTYTANQLRVALLNEHQHFAHDDFNSDVMNAAQYRAFLAPLLLDELITETGCDDTFTLDEFMSTYG